MNDSEMDIALRVLEIFDFTKILLLLVGITLLGLVAKLVAVMGKKLHKRLPSRRLLIAQLVTITSFSIYILGCFYLFYGIVQPPKALLIAISGTLAVALGLSLKDLVASVVAGLILLFDRPFQVGDRVTFDGHYGEIQTIGLRAVRLLTLDDSVVTIPNSRFITDVVSSGNSGELFMMIEINFHLGIEADLNRARQLLYEITVTSPYIFLKKPVVILFSEVESSRQLAMQLKVKCYVIDVRFEKALQTDIFVRGSEALRIHKISRPHLEIVSPTSSLQNEIKGETYGSQYFV